jgi:hypothetical protein
MRRDACKTSCDSANSFESGAVSQLACGLLRDLGGIGLQLGHARGIARAVVLTLELHDERELPEHGPNGVVGRVGRDAVALPSPFTFSSGSVVP